MSYPSVTDDDFYEKINKKYKQYTIPKKRKTYEEICFPKKFELQPQQKFLAEYMSPRTPYKGLLVFHQIGSGKTCTAVRIGEKWKRKRRIMVLLPASLIGNFRGELRSYCADNEYLTEKEREKLKKFHPSSKEYKEIINKSDERINKYYDIYSYNKFVDLALEKKIKLKNTLLIVDEIQNMVSEGGLFYETIYKTVKKGPKDLLVVLLSATPMFDKPVEIALTMNLLPLPMELPVGVEFEKMFITSKKITNSNKKYYKAKNLDMFKEMIKGYVSYYRGAPPYVFPEATIKYVKCEMSEFQYRSYLTVQQAEEKREGRDVRIRKYQAFRKGEILELPNNFFIGTRIISNIAFPNKDIDVAGFKSFKGSCLKMDNLQKYSIKFYKIIQKINRSSGPVFVFSNFRGYGGIESFITVLEAQGYINYATYGEGRKRFAIFSGEESLKLKEEIKAVYNQLSNSNGSRLKIILGSPAIKEGISLLRTRQVHIMEPYWTQARLDQIAGRVLRTCAHAGLDEEKRTVKIYIYMATHPDEEETIDQYIRKLSFNKNRLISEFELALKEAAIDCKLFKNANVYPEEGEQDIKCEK